MNVLGRTKKEVVTEFRTAELLNAARKVFAQRGFYDSTVDAIAELAGVAKGTVYLYYPSKQSIYWAALEQGIIEMNEETRKRVDAATSAEEKIRTVIDFKLRYFEENRDFFKIYFTEFGNALCHPLHVHKRFSESYLQQARGLQAVLEEGIRQGRIRALPADLAALSISDLLRGVITQRLMGWSKGDVQDAINFVLDLVWKGIGTQ